MFRKIVTIVLCFALFFTIVMPFAVSAAETNTVNCSVNQNTVTISWTLSQSRSVKIFRDGTEFKLFTNTKSGSYSVEETGAGYHTYTVQALNGSSSLATASCSVIGTGKPKITLEYSNPYGSSTSDARIRQNVKIYNRGSEALDLSRLKMRYYYTIDGEPAATGADPNNAQRYANDCSEKKMVSFVSGVQNEYQAGNINIGMSFTRFRPELPGVDYYCDTYFQNSPEKINGGYYFYLKCSFEKIESIMPNSEKNTIRNYNPSNDYSFDSSASAYKENLNICVYYDNQLIWGNPPAAALTAPENLTANAVNEDVQLNWSSVSGAEGYEVFRKEEGQSDFTQLQGTLTGNSFLDSTVDGGITYTYRVRAVAGSGSVKSNFSNEVQIKLASSTSIRIQMRNEWPQYVESNTMYPQYTIKNTGNTAIKLSDLRLVYYFNRDSIETLKFYADSMSKYISGGEFRQYVTAKFHKMPAKADGVDTCLVMEFQSGAGTIAPGDSCILQTRITTEPDWNKTFKQLNDYSYKTDASIRGTYTDWDKIAGFLNGELVWGTVPEINSNSFVLEGIARKEGILLKWDGPSDGSYKILKKDQDSSLFSELPGEVTGNTFTDIDVQSGKSYTYKIRTSSDPDYTCGCGHSSESNEVTVQALNLKGNGLYAEYLNWKKVPNSILTNYWYDLIHGTNYTITNTEFALSRIDDKIDFNWKSSSPHEKVNKDHFSVIWSGYVMPNTTQNYIFYTDNDDGARLWLDINQNNKFESNELIIDNWRPDPSWWAEGSKKIKLTKDVKYKMALYYFEDEGDAQARLYWKGQNQGSKSIIPKENLFVSNDSMKLEAPTGLAFELDGNTVTLTWDSVVNATGYKIIETHNGVSRVIDVNTNTHTISNLELGEYSYVVRAYNSSDESDDSPEVKFIIGLPVVENLTYTRDGKQITLKWDGVTGVGQYKIYRSCEGITEIFYSNSTAFVDNNVQNGRVYSYTVAAVKDGYEGGKSNEVLVTVPTLAPGQLTATAGMESVLLSWTAVSGAQTYKLFRAESLDGAYIPVREDITGTPDAGNRISYTDTVSEGTAISGKKYYYKVVSVFNGMDSAPSNIAFATVYPYKLTDLGYLKSNIISRSDKHQEDFILGSYIPVEFELLLNKNTKNISICLTEIANGSQKPFKASMISRSENVSVYAGNVPVGKNNIEIDGSNNKIEIKGEYAANTSIKMQFLIKVSAKDETMNSEIENLYNNMYDMKFSLEAYREGEGNKEIISYSDGTPISLKVKITNPNKLN